MIERRYAEPGRRRVSPFAHIVANCNQLGSRYMAASKQIGVAFCDTPTSQQAKPDHPPTHLPETQRIFVAQDLADIALQPNHFIARRSRSSKIAQHILLENLANINHLTSTPAAFGAGAKRSISTATIAVPARIVFCNETPI
jgi:hypothetical protein